MTITAKFSTVCPSCSARIEAGSKVEWSKGQKARHVSCASAGGKTATSATPKARSWRNGGGRWNGCSMGCRDGSPNPRCKSCCFDEYDC